MSVARAAGHPVAVVVAEGRGVAADAAALVDVEYEPLEGVADAEAALADGAPLVYPEYGSNVCYTAQRGSGDVDAAFASAAHTVSLRVRFARIAPAPLEPRGVLAQYDPATEELTIWLTTQSPSGAREQLAQALDIPEQRVRVIVPDMGGGFGARNPVYPEYIAAAWASRRLGRPVRWVSSRSEDISTTSHARDQVVYLEAAADPDGRLLGLRARVIGNLGSFLYINTQLPPFRIHAMLPGCYKIPAYHAELVTTFTNTTTTGPYRGAGRPQAADCIERLMDVLARELRIDPVELRRRNFIQPDEFPYTTASGVTYDSGDYPGALEKLLAAVDLPGPPRTAAPGAGARRAHPDGHRPRHLRRAERRRLGERLRARGAIGARYGVHRLGRAWPGARDLLRPAAQPLPGGPLRADRHPPRRHGYLPAGRRHLRQPQHGARRHGAAPGVGHRNRQGAAHRGQPARGKRRRRAAGRWPLPHRRHRRPLGRLGPGRGGRLRPRQAAARRDARD